jgi:CO/xanthine dehydrogenase Mo-binding subunit
MARLIRSEKEVEGRYEEVWTLVEEDALVQWPAGPGAVVGRDAPRLDGYEKARGEARYTGDIKLPGMLESALLRSPHARAKVRGIDLTVAAAAPGVLGVVGPGEVAGIEEEAHFEGAAVAGVILGVAGARVVATMAPGVSTPSANTVGGVALALLAAALLALVVPARRANGADPADALRAE